MIFTTSASISRAFVRLGACAAVALVALGGCAAENEPLSGDDSNAEDPSAERISSTAQALSGLTCRQSATDDYNACTGLEFWICYNPPYTSAVYCNQKAKTICTSTYAQANALCDIDVARVYRVLRNGYHNEEKVYAGGTVETSFSFFPRRYTGADPNPIYRCPVESPFAIYNNAIRDFPSRDPNCEGKGQPISVLGYSLPAGVHGAKPVYRCRSGSDHFLSWSSTCEGKVNEGLIGYANQN